jgi:hypothetical protein
MRNAPPLRALLVACALMAAFAAHAQDPRETAVQAAARDWLALTDRLDAANSWRTAGAKFRAELAAQPWASQLRSAREPLGAVQQRAGVSTGFRKDIPGRPDGNYALLQFRTAFANKSEGHESVTLELEPDGVWRVIGYFIR